MATKVEKAVVDLIVDGKSAQLSVKDLGSALNSVTKELRAMAQADDPAKYARLLEEKKKITAEYNKQKVAIGDLRSGWQKFGEEFRVIAMGVVGGNLLTGAIEQAIAFLPEQIDRIIAKKDELANVAKTTNMTDQQVRSLRSSLKELDTRTTLTDLMSLAEVGGQFGVAKVEIEGFVKSADMANVAIGEAFGGAAQTGEQLFKMNNVLKDIEGETVGDRMLYIANALNVLESQGAATADGVADYTVRMGGFLSSMGVAAKDIIGVAAMLEETGTTAERGSTGVVSVYRAMLSESETFAKVAGVPLKEYQELIKKDMTEALKLYVQGLQKVQGDQLKFNAILAESKLNGMGEAEVIAKMVGNYDLWIEKIDDTGAALVKTGSVTDEFGKKNFQMAVELKRIRQYVSELFMSDTIEDYIGRGMHAVAEFLPVLKSLGKWIGEQRTLWNVLGVALLIYYGNVIKATAASIAYTTVELAKNAALRISNALIPIQAAGLRILTIGHQLLTGQITLATAAQRLWNLALNANPLGVAIGLIAALAGAIKLYSDNTREAIALEKKKRDMTVLLTEVTADNGKAQQYLNDRVNDYANLSKAEQESLRKEILLRKEKLKAQLQNIEAQKMEMMQMAANPTVWQKFMGMMTSGGNVVNFAGQMAQQAADNMQQVNDQYTLQIDNLKDSLESYDQMTKRLDGLDRSPTPGAGYTPGGGGDDKKAKAKAAKEAKAKEAKEAKARLPQVEKVSEKDYEVKRKADTFEEPDMKGAFEGGMVPLEDEYAQEQHGINMRETNKQIGSEQANLEKLAAQERYLTAKLLLEQAYNESSIQTQRELNENLMQQEQERATQDVEQKLRMKEAEWGLQDAKREAMMQGVEILKSFLSESSGLYKAFFVAQKAMAIADVIIKLQREIAAINLAYAAIPGGQAFSLPLTAAAKIRAGISIATIGAQAVQGLIPKKAKGGYTDMRSLAEGFTSRSTLYSMPGRQYIAGEEGREFILSNAALQVPAVANFAAIMDGLQKSRNYAMSAALQPGGGGGSDPALLAALGRMEARFAGLEAGITKQGARPVVFSHDKFEASQDFMYKILDDTSV